MSAIARLYRGENDYNFSKAWRFGMILSSILFVISIGSLATRGLNLGIDFKGGISWEVKAPNTSVEQTREVLCPIGLCEAKVQVLNKTSVRVQASAESVDKQNQVREALGKLAGVPANEVGVSTVGPTWGSEITGAAVRALIVFLVCILGYVTLTFRGEWKLAVGVVVAVIHDIVISVGVYSIFQFEVTPATVIAFLTILGYSIYDTVVVYDKVQENAARVGVASRMTYTEMMNLSMNQVLMRSINTSVVAVLPVLSTLIVGAFILGAVTLEEFAIALTVGLTIGAYSSIFVAAPVVVWMKEQEPRNRQLRERLAATASRAAANGPDDAAVVAEDAGGVATGGGTATKTKPAATARAVDPQAYSRNHPPRPRKQGKKR